MGYDGTLLVGALEAKHIKDVTVDMAAAEADDTTRNNDGWESAATGLKRWTVSFNMVKKEGDNVYAYLKSAFKLNTEIMASVTDEQNDTIEGACKVSKFTRNEPLRDVVTVDVTLVGRGKPTWD
jgi:predicted secreted protein